jgi:hypothetical protein
MIMGFILLLYLFVNVVLCIMVINNSDTIIENEVNISKLKERIEKMELERGIEKIEQ